MNVLQFCSIIYIFFPNEKQLGGSYEVSFISALWMVSSESRKRLHSIYYAHDCSWKRAWHHIYSEAATSPSAILFEKFPHLAKFRPPLFCSIEKKDSDMFRQLVGQFHRKIPPYASVIINILYQFLPTIRHTSFYHHSCLRAILWPNFLPKTLSPWEILSVLIFKQ